jgi:hypothetical protein
MVFASKVMSDWAKALPVKTAWCSITTLVLLKMVPLKLDVVPSWAKPATFQKMFCGKTPPVKVMVVPLAAVRFPVVQKIKTEELVPDKVTPVDIVISVVQ